MNTAHSAGPPSTLAKAMSGKDTAPNGSIREDLTGYVGNAIQTSGMNLTGLLNKPNETQKTACIFFITLL